MKRSPQRLIFRNTALLVGAQVIVAPLSLLINAVTARTLGAADFGQLYLATTFASLAFLLVEWGQPNALTARVSQDRSRAGELLGSGLCVRGVILPCVVLAAIIGCALAGYDRRFIEVLLLVFLASAFTTMAAACQDVMRGFERSDVAAASIIAYQVLGALVVVPTLLLAGSLPAFLLAQAACAAVGALIIFLLLPRLGVPRLSMHRPTSIGLVQAGTSFMLFNVILALQPNVDAVFLSKLASPEAIGWQAVARKLTGLLVFPSSALSVALFPTLSRLHAQDRTAFYEVAAGAVRATPALAMPLALGCVLFPELGTSVFGAAAFAPAAINIRVLGGFVLLLYVTMPLGSTLLAAGRQRAWLVAQCGCVVLSTILDPLLIAWFQRHMGNGGLGVCIATVAGEVSMVAAGLYLLPRGVLERVQWRAFGAIAAAGATMAATAWLLSPLSAYLAAPLAFIVYAVCLWFTGGVGKSQIVLLSSLIRKRSTPL